MNEEKNNPMLSYHKEDNKPILLNDEAVFACVNYIKDKTKAEVDFDVDDLFKKYMWEQGVASKTYPHDYTQEEINDFVWKMVEECSEVEEEEMRPIGEIIMEKHGLENNNDNEDIPMGC